MREVNDQVKKYAAGVLLAIAACGIAGSILQSASDPAIPEERLSFQTGAKWQPRTHIQSDVAMVYGIGPTLPERMKTWKERGYRIHVMTGVAWGQYQDYLNGKFDGTNHWDEAQTTRDGTKIMHGNSTDVPYMSPGKDYGKYLTVGVKRALDAGAEAIHLEEPEFWARGGYSQSFRREWKAYYGENWQPPHSSPDAQYRASKLKYFLYRRALSQVFDFVKDYGKQNGRVIPCYVPTHSLINYAHWRIVSPESSLLEVGADGYIAQVWTGTSRTPNVYEGRRKERTFETAFLEYGAMQNLVRASGRRVWYLNDPIEDNPNHSWEDYRTNWESTLTASLLQPEVWRYEVMPWPDRIFTRPYPVKNLSERKPGEEVERVPIPKAYETELQAVIRALGDMKQPESTIRWEHSGTRGIGVLVSDTMMFQRAEPNPSDSNLGSFYGLAMPLVKRGIPVEPVQIESATQPGFLKPYRLLFLTYEGQKPPKPEFHRELADWVRAGGALVVVDDDRDPYNAAHDWWNTAPHTYKTPRHHLFEALGIPPQATGLHRVGKGIVLRENQSPAALTYQATGAEEIRQMAKRAAAEVKMAWKESNALVLRRGPYVVAAGLDESVPGIKPVELTGRFIDLFDAELRVLPKVVLSPGKRALLMDLDRVKTDMPRIAAAATWVKQEKANAERLQFRAEGIAESGAVVQVMAKRAPTSVQINGKALGRNEYDFEGQMLRLHFRNRPEGVPVEVQFGNR